MEKYKFQAKSSDEILSKALTELGVKEEEIVSKMYEEKGGLFSGKKYVLEVVKISEVAEVGKEILSELLAGMSIKANVETKIRNGAIRYEIYSDKSSIIIGKNGHILDAIQTYVRQALFNAIDIFVNVSVDASGYKDKQNYFLEKGRPSHSVRVGRYSMGKLILQFLEDLPEKILVLEELKLCANEKPVLECSREIGSQSSCISVARTWGRGHHQSSRKPDRNALLPGFLPPVLSCTQVSIQALLLPSSLPHLPPAL